MKKISLIALLMLMVCGIGYAKKNGAKIEMAETVWDFGTIPRNKGVAHDFVFTNTGDSNLVIIDATTQCGCTVAEVPQEPIAPGKQGKIKVVYNAVGMPQSFEKTVTVKTNGTPKKLHLKVRGILK